MAKRKGKSARKNNVRQQQRQQQRPEQTMMAGPVATGRGPQGQGNSGRNERKVEGGGRIAKPASATPMFVSEIEGMSDEWRAFYRVVSQAVQER